MQRESVPPCPKCGGPRVRYGPSSPRCRPCLAAKAIARYHKDPEPHIARMKARREAKPEAMAAARRAWREANRDRIGDYNAQYYVKNRAAEIARSLAYTKENPNVDRSIKQRREALKRAAICEHGKKCVTSAFLAAVYGAPCNYCGKPATEADHYKPISRGGLHCRDNIVPACKSCNCSKHAQDPEEWLARRRRTG